MILNLYSTYFREKSILSSALLVIARHPASSLRSGIGQVITMSESCPTSNLGGLTSVKLLFDICIKWPLIHPKAFKHFSVPPPKGIRKTIYILSLNF